MSAVSSPEGALSQMGAAQAGTSQAGAAPAGAQHASSPAHGEAEAMVSSAVGLARAVQPAWAQLPVRERAALARRFSRLVLAAEDEILDVITQETHKNRLSAFEEVLDVALLAAYYAGTAPRLLRPSSRRGAVPLLTHTTQTHHPRGVVGVITPWNYPFTLPASDSLPALLAGNAVVLKPDDATKRSAALVADLLARAGLPDGLFQIVNGPGPSVGAALVRAADFIQFTGSTATGRVVAAACGEELTPFSCELGGKNVMLVLSDADVEAAADGAVRACFSSYGELCVSMEYFYVHRDLEEAFTKAFLSRVAAMRVGPGSDWDIDMGGLISVPHLAKVMSHIEDAVAKGARVLAGGRQRPDLGPTFMEPTVLTDVTAEMIVSSQETFGPVVTLARMESDAEAAEISARGEYGLNASLWSRSHGRALAGSLSAGSVNINEGYAATWGSHDASIGGWRDSGIGARHGREGLLKYTRVQTVSQQRVLPLGSSRLLSNAGYHRLMASAAPVLGAITSRLPARKG